MNRLSLSLADIEAFDPQGPPARRLCPLCGTDKPRDGAHRSLSLDRESGLWNCFRCGAGGRITEKWESGGRRSDLERARDGLRANFTLLPLPVLRSEVEAVATGEAPAPCNSDESGGVGQDAPERVAVAAQGWDWRTAWQNSRVLAGTAGAHYLRGRGIKDAAMAESSARFCRNWSGRPSVVFPICDRAGTLVAAQGRALRGDAKRTFGPKKEGAFFAPIAVEGMRFGPLDARAPAVILVEAPIDALSIASCGFPALALCGTSGPSWLHIACGLRRVLLAFDADDAGEAAATKLAPTLQRFGARCERLAPEGFKDWNDALVEAPDQLADWLAAHVLAL